MRRVSISRISNQKLPLSICVHLRLSTLEIPFIRSGKHNPFVFKYRVLEIQ